MMFPRFVSLSLAAVALLVGLGSDLAGEGRAPVSDDPSERLERGLLAPTQDEPMGDVPAGSMRAQDDAGPTPPVAVTSLGIAGAHHGSVSQPESSPPRGPPGEAAVRHVVPAVSRPASTTLRSTHSTLFVLAVVRPGAVHAS